MEIREGYRQTEVGIIPEEWECLSLGDLFKFKNGLNKGKEFFGHGTPIVNYNDVYLKTEIRVKDILGRVSLSSKEIKLFEVLRGDVFFTRTSETPEEVGISSVIIEDVEDTVFSGFLIRARPINKKLDLYYKKYCFSTKSVRNEIVSKCTYTTRALTNGKVLSGVQIIVPPLPEQQAIATALSDIDGLINSLQKLIDKKKKIKQGAMQELLTGKIRLEGFSGEWVEVRLGDIAEVTMGQSPDSRFYNTNNAGIPLVQGNADIDNRKTIIRNYTLQITKQAKKGDIIMTVRAPVGYIGKASYDCCIGRGVCAISCKNDYLYHYCL
jgi:type I restriction enzyme S subunit